MTIQKFWRSGFSPRPSGGTWFAGNSGYICHIDWKGDLAMTNRSRNVCTAMKTAITHGSDPRFLEYSRRATLKTHEAKAQKRKLPSCPA